MPLTFNQPRLLGGEGGACHVTYGDPSRPQHASVRAQGVCTDWTKPLKSIDVWNFAEDCV